MRLTRPLALLTFAFVTVLAFGAINLYAADDNPLANSTVEAVNAADKEAEEKEAVKAVAEENVSTLEVAAAAAKSDTAPGIGLGPIVAALGALIAILGAIMNFIPMGWRTHANLLVGVLVTIYSALGDLSATGKAATMGVILTALVGAFIGKLKSNKTPPTD